MTSTHFISLVRKACCRLPLLLLLCFFFVGGYTSETYAGKGKGKGKSCKTGKPKKGKPKKGKKPAKRHPQPKAPSAKKPSCDKNGAKSGSTVGGEQQPARGGVTEAGNSNDETCQCEEEKISPCATLGEWTVDGILEGEVYYRYQELSFMVTPYEGDSSPESVEVELFKKEGDNWVSVLKAEPEASQDNDTPSYSIDYTPEELGDYKWKISTYFTVDDDEYEYLEAVKCGREVYFHVAKPRIFPCEDCELWTWDGVEDGGSYPVGENLDIQIVPDESVIDNEPKHMFFTLYKNINGRWEEVDQTEKEYGYPYFYQGSLEGEPYGWIPEEEGDYKLTACMFYYFPETNELAECCKSVVFHIGDEAGSRLTAGVNSELQVDVYPNPSSDIVTLTMGMEEESPVKVFVFDALGKVVYEYNNVSTYLHQRVNLRQFGAGIYTVNVMTADSKSVHKVVIQ